MTARTVTAEVPWIRAVLGRATAEYRARRVRRWARARLGRGDAVILDTETSDLYGQIVQISIIDLTGQPLLNTLVRAGEPIAPAATAVHGIRDIDLLQAPSLLEVAPQLLRITKGREILAYNAPYDRDVITAGLTQCGIPAAHLANRKNWTCLMRARATIERQPWRALNGPHEALGDCVAALQVLRTIARV